MEIKQTLAPLEVPRIRKIATPLRLLHACVLLSLCMSALIFTGDLQEVLPGELAVRGEPGKQCAVCESCKRLVCKVLG